MSATNTFINSRDLWLRVVCVWVDISVAVTKVTKNSRGYQYNGVVGMVTMHRRGYRYIGAGVP